MSSSLGGTSCQKSGRYFSHSFRIAAPLVLPVFSWPEKTGLRFSMLTQQYFLVTKVTKVVENEHQNMVDVEEIIKSKILPKKINIPHSVNRCRYSGSSDKVDDLQGEPR